ncbi:SufS family cysteine desulfurase [Colwelliaceae bacterium 6471]
MNCFNVVAFRQQFPLLKKTLADMPLVYFDNAATTQKPQSMLDCLQSYYCQSNANVHRASHALSAQSTVAFEQARKIVKNFIGASAIQEIIWTKGATESANLIAQSWGRENLSVGDEIVLSYAEHHANIVPWQIVAEQTGAVIKVLPLDKNGRIDVNQLANVITEKAKAVCIAHISNVLGRINPVESVIARAKQVGAITVIDGAQAVAHQMIDVSKLDCDFYFFSAHKMYGPTGVGVLYGRQSLLESMVPYQAGGEMIKTVSFEKTTYNSLPFKFEPGTPNIAGVIAFANAVDFLRQQHDNNIGEYEQKLLSYCYQELLTINEVNFIVADRPDIPVFSFTVDNHHNHDISAALDTYGIAVRSGHHCAMPLMTYLNISGCTRVSLAPYNTFAEVDYFITSLKKIISGESYDTPEEQLIEPDKITQIESDKIKALFANATGWDSRHREIMLLGKQLMRMPKEQRNEQTLISGCESQAWLSYTVNEQGEFSFTADSDAKVIRGLLVIVLAAYNGKTSQQIRDFDINDYFDSLGLLQHLSPSRGNGLNAIVDKILRLAQ